MRIAAAFAVGLIFGLGIMVSGMANPAKVINFFDVAGAWDPSLAFVMGGALVTTMIGYRVVLARPGPVFDKRFQVPTRSGIDRRLVAGSAIFGVGWGIAGFCPGGALPALGTGRADVAAFVAALMAGIFAARFVTNRIAGRPSGAGASPSSTSAATR